MEEIAEARAPRVARQISSNVALKKSKKQEQVTRAKTMGGFDKSRPEHLRNRKTITTVEDLLVCGICTKRMQKPKMLPCQHTFCSACLGRIMVGQEIKCPECIISVVLKDGLEALPSNLYLDSLLLALQKKDIDTPCNQCQTITSLTPCRHCAQSLCRVCWEHHMKEMRTLLLALGDQLQGAKERLENRIKDFEKMCSTLMNQIDKAVEDKIQALNGQRKQLKDETSKLRHDGEISSKQLFQEIQKAEDRLASGSNFDTLKDTDSKISLFLELHGITSALLGKVSHWGDGSPSLDKDALKLRRTNDDVDHAPTQLDSASTEDSCSYDYRTRLFRSPCAQVAVMHPGGVAVKGSKLYVAGCDSRCILVLDMNKKMKLLQRLTSPSLLYPRSIAMNENEIYVTDKWAHCIHVFSALDGAYKRQMCRKGRGEGHLRSPEGIALGQGPNRERDLLYVCDTGNDRVQVLRSEDGKVVRILGILSIPGSHLAHTELDQPTSVAVHNEKIIIMDFGNCRIKVYSLNGKKEAEFGSRGTFGSADCIAVDKNGFILVGGSDISRIFVFRPTGVLVRTISNSKFVSVSGLAVTSDMGIVVADNRTDSVLIY